MESKHLFEKYGCTPFNHASNRIKPVSILDYLAERPTQHPVHHRFVGFMIAFLFLSANLLVSIRAHMILSYAYRLLHDHAYTVRFVHSCRRRGSEEVC